MGHFGFKEWKMVCDVIGRGEQAVLLRKGGISEGKLGFQWLHNEFFLFPTHFHGQADQLRPGSADPDVALSGSEPDVVSIGLFAEIVTTRRILVLEEALALEPLHVWKPAVVEERFLWGEAPGLSLAVIRPWRLAAPWALEQRPAFGGCRSWLGLPAREGLPADWRDTMTPVLPEARISEVVEAIGALTGSAAP
ncbi:MAG: DUF1802 family protein [Verrucomicrobia bacterium]|nr:DUF1802 family protein [Verrucomicrobiota bacterium]